MINDIHNICNMDIYIAYVILSPNIMSFHLCEAAVVRSICWSADDSRLVTSLKRLQYVNTNVIYIYININRPRVCPLSRRCGPSAGRPTTAASLRL